MSSADDLDVRDPENSLGDGVGEAASSPGPFQNVQMSKAAQTHRLRRLRAPTKCRDCDGLVVFHGAECEECSLVCHKKCLEVLSIQCGHRKLQGRLALFGEDFSLVARASPDGVPFIVRKCAAEVESRALTLKGIYRVNGAKSRVEKLCQAFENGKELVELSDHSPHDVSNVLKLYLRQLPEPLIQYRFYNDVISIAKETQKIIMVEAAAEQEAPRQTLTVEVQRVVLKMKDLLRHLPTAHYRTLHFLLAHLYRVSEQEEENKMSASNLGIIFGPTLVRAQPTGAEVSLSSLVDYPYQALAVELLIRYHQEILPLPVTSALPQGLPRNSHSLLDIKEAQSSRGQHRYSWFVPEVQHSDGLQQETGRSAGSTRNSPVLLRSPPSLQQRMSPRPMSVPVTTPVCMPVSVPVSRPEGVPVSRPEGAPVSRPEGVPVSRPEGAPVSRPEGAPVSRPEGVPVSRPEGAPVSRPEGVPVSRPEGVPVSRPDESPQSAGCEATDADTSTHKGAETSAAGSGGTTPAKTDAAMEPHMSAGGELGVGADARTRTRTRTRSHAQPDEAAPTVTSCSAAPGADAPDSGAKTASDANANSAASVPAAQAHGTVLDPQALRRTWEKEYRPPLLTPRTAMILANLPRPPAATSASPPPACVSASSTSASSSSASSSSVSTIFSRSPYCVSVGRGGPPVAFRAPRTLHPPPGTFYQPPQTQSPMTADTPLIPTPSTASTPSTAPTPTPSTASTLSTASTPSTAPTPTPSTAPSSITRQRLCSSLQELEPREAHFV